MFLYKVHVSMPTGVFVSHFEDLWGQTIALVGSTLTVPCLNLCPWCGCGKHRPCDWYCFEFECWLHTSCLDCLPTALDFPRPRFHFSVLSLFPLFTTSLPTPRAITGLKCPLFGEAMPGTSVWTSLFWSFFTVLLYLLFAFLIFIPA